MNVFYTSFDTKFKCLLSTYLIPLFIFNAAQCRKLIKNCMAEADNSFEDGVLIFTSLVGSTYNLLVLYCIGKVLHHEFSADKQLSALIRPACDVLKNAGLSGLNAAEDEATKAFIAENIHNNVSKAIYYFQQANCLNKKTLPLIKQHLMVLNHAKVWETFPASLLNQTRATTLLVLCERYKTTAKRAVKELVHFLTDEKQKIKIKYALLGLLTLKAFDSDIGQADPQKKHWLNASQHQLPVQIFYHIASFLIEPLASKHASNLYINKLITSQRLTFFSKIPPKAVSEQTSSSLQKDIVVDEASAEKTRQLP